jgi:hypothetical protein
MKGKKLKSRNAIHATDGESRRAAVGKSSARTLPGARVLDWNRATASMILEKKVALSSGVENGVGCVINENRADSGLLLDDLFRLGELDLTEILDNRDDNWASCCRCIQLLGIGQVAVETTWIIGDADVEDEQRALVRHNAIEFDAIEFFR